MLQKCCVFLTKTQLRLIWPPQLQRPCANSHAALLLPTTRPPECQKIWWRQTYVMEIIWLLIGIIMCKYFVRRGPDPTSSYVPAALHYNASYLKKFRRLTFWYVCKCMYEYVTVFCITCGQITFICLHKFGISMFREGSIRKAFGSRFLPR